MNKFLDVVPKGVKVAAPIVMASLTIIGTVVGYCVALSNHNPGHFMPVIGLAVGLGLGLLAGVFFAVWLLCLGYVYADAKRRGMRPVLWTLIAALFPHLFGFLLYFALRHPMTPRCTRCGQPVMLDQRFCSWCGAAGPLSGGSVTGASEVGSVPAV